MTAPMEATEAQTILDGMKVEGWPGVYVLGCLDRRVTIYSQQVRALNLAAALVASRTRSGSSKPRGRQPARASTCVLGCAG